MVEMLKRGQATGKVSKVPAGTSVLATSFLPRAVYTVPIKDNTEFVTKFDKSTFSGVVARPTKTVIVDQDPGPGEIIPAGASVNVTLTVKDVIPVESFPEINAAVLKKYTTIGDVETDLEKPEDTVAKDAKDVLDKNVDYNALSARDKEAVDSFMADRFGQPAVEDIEVKAKVYNDIRFLRHL